MARHALESWAGHDILDSGIAKAGGSQLNATAIAYSTTRLSTTATHFDAVRLPLPAVGDSYTLINAGPKDASVYPTLSGFIDLLPRNVPYVLSSGSIQKFQAVTPTQWYTLNKGQRYVNAPNTGIWMNQSAMTKDSTFRDWDVSSLIPPAAWGKPCTVLISICDTTANNSLSLVPKGDGANAVIFGVVNTPASGVIHEDLRIVKTNASGVFQYKATPTLTSGSLTVTGWWVEG